MPTFEARAGRASTFDVSVQVPEELRRTRAALRLVDVSVPAVLITFGFLHGQIDVDGRELVRGDVWELFSGVGRVSLETRLHAAGISRVPVETSLRLHGTCSGLLPGAEVGDVREVQAFVKLRGRDEG
jgi:hypothetical protein